MTLNRFNDGTVKCIFPNGEEENLLNDGIIERVNKNGVKIVSYPNGDKEVVPPDSEVIQS